MKYEDDYRFDDTPEDYEEETYSGYKEEEGPDYGEPDYEEDAPEGDEYRDGDEYGYADEYGYGEEYPGEEPDYEPLYDEFGYEYDYDAQAYIRSRVRIRRLIVLLAVSFVLTAVISVLSFLYSYYKVRNVRISGSTRYTDEEIEDFVMGGFLGDNSLVMGLRYRDKAIEDVPFVEAIDVQILSHDSVDITVYEKTLAGYVSYLGSLMYFDRSGTVVESANERAEGIPEVTGLKFSRIVLGQKLPIEDPGIFDRILDISQILAKYGLTADRIYFDSHSNMSVYFGNVRAELGNDDYMDEKVSNIEKILPSLEGKKGTLEMSTYSSSTEFITFKEDQEKEED